MVMKSNSKIHMHYPEDTPRSAGLSSVSINGSWLFPYVAKVWGGRQRFD